MRETHSRWLTFDATFDPPIAENVKHCNKYDGCVKGYIIIIMDKNEALH